VPVGMRLTAAIVTLGVAIPITAIAGGIAGFPAIVAVWIGMVGINLSLGAPGLWRRRP
jgi:hypothetical protein